MKYLITFCTAILFLACASNKKEPIRIFMAGDSTMANKVLEKTVFDSISGDSITAPFMERGWGHTLPAFFTDDVVIRNYAKNGRSSRTFINEGLWDSITTNIQANDFVIIQFGHNDESKNKTDRYTPPADYVKNLSRFVDDALSKGAKPIICTSVVRRRFDSEGNFQDSHGEYLDLARQVARDKNIPMIDMYEKSKKLLLSLGVENSIPLFMHIPVGESPIFPDGKIDNTHFRERGALAMDSLFIEGLKELKITELVDRLK